MEGSYLDCYAFITEWYDSQASLVRQFKLSFYPMDNTLEMYDLKSRKIFVRRTLVDGVTLDKFYIGCTLHIFGRLIKIIDYACESTKKRLQKELQVTCVIIKPLPNSTVGKIITHFNKHNLHITRMKRAKWTLDDIAFIYRNMTADPTYPFLLEYIGGNYTFVLELVGKNIYEVTAKIVGDRDPLKAEPGTIRALYGTDSVRNCVHISNSEEIAREDLAYVFPPPSARASHLRLTATLSNCTLCIAKPHAVYEGKLGGIIEAIDEAGFNITALNMLVVENINASEFYEVYKGIVPEYKGMVEELASGACVAMELVAKDKSVSSAVEFRKAVGPADPEIARLLRPHTLRAKFGVNKVKNAVHCSDLPEDGLLEVEYFFKILDL
ncbi:hypothetical protein O0L34_g9753 [Tuta absoluta]|nr:hypothetical protein O0L34_g9753 [Tuta absoluta]